MTCSCPSSPRHMHCRFLQQSGRHMFVALVAFLIAADAIISTLWLLPVLFGGFSLRLQQSVGAWMALNIISNFLVCVLCSPGKSVSSCLQGKVLVSLTCFCTQQQMPHPYTGRYLVAGYPHQYVDMRVPGQTVSSRQYENFTWCKQCNSAKPPQAHHCR